MCGICGKISSGSHPVEEKLLKTMCRSFSHRGPDDEGIHLSRGAKLNGFSAHAGMGHQRLAVIDLSPSARQPMSNEDGTIWTAYNGEIYNYRELRAELERKGHKFKSDSDTEVIVHLYEEEGIGAVRKCNGMFAFALFDENCGRLCLCRDRLGIKPLVYYWDGDQLIFASEIKALLTDPSVPKELNYEALYLYLAFNYIPAPHTIFSAIHKLEPAHYIIFEQGRLTIEKYWEPPRTVDPYISKLPSAAQENYCRKMLHECLEDAVISRMIADVPLGAFLSGGIDSSIVAALMAQNSAKQVKTFSIGYTDDALYDETDYARQVARRYNTEHHEFRLSCKDMLNAIPHILSFFDEPFADSSVLPTFIVSMETKKYVTVALAGDGGDELFAGYRSYLAEYWLSKYLMIPGVFRKELIERLVKKLPDSRDDRHLEYVRRVKKFIKGTKGSFPERVLSLKEIFPKSIRHEILLNFRQNHNAELNDPALTRVAGLLDYYQNDRLNCILYSDLADSLPGDMLTKVDWMSMINSLEVRVPFLDHRVVELAFKMPGCLKLKNGRMKYILKETFKDLLPPGIYRRSKAGFEVPISRWLKNELKYLLDQYLAEDRIQEQGIFDPAIIRQLVGHHLSGKTDTSWMLWNIIVFQSWYENYFL